MATDAQNRATANYRKKNVKQLTIRFYPGEVKEYEWAKEHGGSTYIKSLIHLDILMRGSK